MEPDCVDCEYAIRSVSHQPHYQDVALQKLASRTHRLDAEASRSELKKATEFLGIILQASQERHPDDLGEMADAILDLAYYDNPISQLFAAVDAGLSSGTEFSKVMQDQ